MVRGKLSILVLGASYGLILGLKASFCGHRVTFVCRPEEIDLINQGNAAVQIPSKHSAQVIELRAEAAPERPTATSPNDVETDDYDFCILAMQEPQYSNIEITELISKISHANLPILSIMNMPLPPLFSGALQLDLKEISEVWHNADIWSAMDPTRFSAASPDPQAMMIGSTRDLLVRVNHPTNIKAAPFANDEAQQTLQHLAKSIDNLVVSFNGEEHEIGVRLIAHHHPLVSMAKWPMLITGNFRCWSPAGIISIGDAVHSDLQASAELYEWVSLVCQKLCRPDDVEGAPLVPFHKYADAAHSLTLPSSLARGLSTGVPRVERVDKLLQKVAMSFDMQNASLDRIVSDVDSALAMNSSQLVG